MPRPLPPDAIALFFAQWVRQKFAELIPRIVAALEIREDANVVTDWRRRVRIVTAETFTMKEADAAYGIVSDRVERFGTGPIERLARVNTLALAAVRDQVTAMREEVLDRISSLPDDVADSLGPLIDEATSKGLRVEELAKQIEERAEVSRSRAMLIARDQTLTLNAKVTEARQRALGVRQFKWRTSRDQRVRESHAEMEDVVCSWDDLPIVDGEETAPGESIQCRCTAEAVIPDDFDFEAAEAG